MSLEATTASVKTKAEAADQLNSTVKFQFNGGEGVIFVDGNTDPNSVSNEDKEADCTILVDYEDFQKMLSGEMNPMGAFMGGKLKVEGNMGVAMKLTNIF